MYEAAEFPKNTVTRVQRGTPETCRCGKSRNVAAPENKILHFAKGSALGSLKRFNEAKTAYLNAIALDADYFDAYNNLGSLYLDQAIPLIDKMNNLGLSQADQKKYNSLKSQRNKLYKGRRREQRARATNHGPKLVGAMC